VTLVFSTVGISVAACDLFLHVSTIHSESTQPSHRYFRLGWSVSSQNCSSQLPSPTEATVMKNTAILASCSIDTVGKSDTQNMTTWCNGEEEFCVTDKQTTQFGCYWVRAGDLNGTGAVVTVMGKGRAESNQTLPNARSGYSRLLVNWTCSCSERKPRTLCDERM
jgi:hypothetical protein